MEANFGPEGLIFLNLDEAKHELLDDTDQPFFEVLSFTLSIGKEEGLILHRDFPTQCRKDQCTRQPTRH
jgi:hypothetical protein